MQASAADAYTLVAAPLEKRRHWVGARRDWAVCLGPIYRFPEPTRFSGPHFWNPYTRMAGSWQRTNLHAHGHSWVGLTNGQQSDEEVVQRYRDLGYTVPGVSDDSICKPEPSRNKTISLIAFSGFELPG